MTDATAFGLVILAAVASPLLFLAVHIWHHVAGWADDVIDRNFAEAMSRPLDLPRPDEAARVGRSR